MADPLKFYAPLILTPAASFESREWASVNATELVTKNDVAGFVGAQITA